MGAHEWRRKGIEIPAAGGRIHPHYGVFAPIRHEYVDLVAKAPLPAAATALGTAFDIGTGTGVLAAVLARRGLRRIVATDCDPRALACARENVQRLGVAGAVDVVQADLFPPGRAALVVCNPPWVPARPSTPIEQGIFDPESRMLRAFVAGLAAHLEPGGEGWLDPLRSRGAPGIAHARGASRDARRGRPAGRAADGRAPDASQVGGRGGSPARGARGRGHLAVATGGALV